MDTGDVHEGVVGARVEDLQQIHEERDEVEKWGEEAKRKTTWKEWTAIDHRFTVSLLALEFLQEEFLAVIIILII